MFGTAGTFTSAHIEGGGFCSLNLIINEDGEKCWLCLDEEASKLFQEKVSALKLQTNKCRKPREGKNCRKGRPCKTCSCKKSAFHGPGFFLYTRIFT